MRWTHAAIEEVQCEHFLVLGGPVTETTLHVRERISLDQHRHDVTVVQGNGDGADRGDQGADGDDQIQPAWNAAAVPCVRAMDLRCFQGAPLRLP